MTLLKYPKIGWQKDSKRKIGMVIIKLLSPLGVSHALTSKFTVWADINVDLRTCVYICIQKKNSWGFLDKTNSLSSASTRQDQPATQIKQKLGKILRFDLNWSNQSFCFPVMRKLPLRRNGMTNFGNRCIPGYCGEEKTDDKTLKCPIVSCQFYSSIRFAWNDGNIFPKSRDYNQLQLTAIGQSSPLLVGARDS